MSWKNALKQGQEIVLTTSSKDGKPNAIVVVSRGFIEGKLLINDCQMNRTIKNIKSNSFVCLVVKYNKEYYRIKGKTKSYTAGKYFQEAVKREISYQVKNAIVVEIKEVFDLDKVKRVY